MPYYSILAVFGHFLNIFLPFGNFLTKNRNLSYRLKLWFFRFARSYCDSYGRNFFKRGDTSRWCAVLSWVNILDYALNAPPIEQWYIRQVTPWNLFTFFQKKIGTKYNSVSTSFLYNIYWISIDCNKRAGVFERLLSTRNGITFSDVF